MPLVLPHSLCGSGPARSGPCRWVQGRGALSDPFRPEEGVAFVWAQCHVAGREALSVEPPVQPEVGV